MGDGMEMTNSIHENPKKGRPFIDSGVFKNVT